MTPPKSAGDAQSLSDLPGSAVSMRFLLQLGYRYQPSLMWVSLGVTILAALPDALFALWLSFLARGLSDAADPDRTLVVVAGVGLGFSAVGGWLLKAGGERIQTRLRQRLAVALETHVARLQATSTGVEHHERPEVLDRLAMLRDQVFTLDHVFLSLFGGLAIALRLGIVLAVLATVQPWMLLLGVAALPPVWAAARRGRAESEVWESVASRRRLARHLFVLGAEPASAKELRVSGASQAVATARTTAWNSYLATMERARIRSALVQAASWAVFAAAFIVAIRTTASGRSDSQAADVLIVVAAGARLTAYISAAATEIDTFGFFVQGAKRLLWLDRLVARGRAEATDVPPDLLRSGIALRHVSFTYPGSERTVLDDVDLEFPAGEVVAVVGENGAGKSTLVKLLAGMYEPTAGSVEVDGVDLRRIDSLAWRERMGGAFQDFVRFEFAAQRSVGLGDLPRLDDEPAAAAAVDRAGAQDVIDRLPAGLATQLGPSWEGGVDLSGGQWQKVSLARGLARERPLLVMLDEPTSALDAETEHALFERFAEQAQQARDDGRVTILVSHRFSTVRMADRIVVLSGSTVVEQGSHEELMALGGTYAELYTIQAAAYR